ncbi:hypothetical protein PybrP1_002231, partial [[Pythium] brassicae (nom. inval.)]
ARPQLSLRERKLKNLHKRVKLRSKRLRAHWGAIAAFLDIRSCVALASTCRRLAPLLQDDRVWERAYAQAYEQPLTRLLVSEQQAVAVANDPARRKLQRLRRLREAERELHQAITRQQKVREFFRATIAFAVVLCSLSTWSYLAGRGNAPEPLAGSPFDRHDRNKDQGDSIKTFLLALDFLMLVTVLLLSFGSSGVTDSGLGTMALLAFLQFAVMAFTLLVWASLDQLLHAGVVLVALVVSAAVAKRKQREFDAELAAFVGKY